MAVTPNRAYPLPDVGGSFDAWGTVINDSVGVTGSGVSPNVDEDMQKALDDSAQGITDAAAAQATADAALPKAGALTAGGSEGQLTGRVDSHTGTFRILVGGSTGVVILDMSDSDAFNLVLTGNITSLSVTGLGTLTDQAQVLMLFITSNGFTIDFTGLGTVTFTGGVPPELSNGEDIIAFITEDAGTNWRGVVLQKNLQ